MRTPRSLAEIDVQWPWIGKGTLVMGRQDLEERYRFVYGLYSVITIQSLPRQYFSAVFYQSVIDLGGKANYDDIMKIISERLTPGDSVSIMRFGDVHKVSMNSAVGLHLNSQIFLTSQRMHLNDL